MIAFLHLRERCRELEPDAKTFKLRLSDEAAWASKSRLYPLGHSPYNARNLFSVSLIILVELQWSETRRGMNFSS